MNINISRIKESDFEDMISLFHEFAAFEKVPEKMLNSVEQMKQEKGFFNGFIAKNESGNIIGYVTFFFGYYTWIGKSLYMDDLYVRDAYRSQGIGAMLINEVIAFSKKENCRKMRWQVSNWNEKAIQFYENLGATIDRVEMNCDLLLK